MYVQKTTSCKQINPAKPIPTLYRFVYSSFTYTFYISGQVNSWKNSRLPQTCEERTISWFLYYIQGSAQMQCQMGHLNFMTSKTEWVLGLRPLWAWAGKCYCPFHQQSLTIFSNLIWAIYVNNVRGYHLNLISLHLQGNQLLMFLCQRQSVLYSRRLHSCHPFCPYTLLGY